MADNAAKAERLTDAQRKHNHIQSERQRREAVRNGFNQLSDIVPGMTDQGKSEVKVLTATVDYISEQLKLKEDFKQQCMQLGMSEGDFEQVYRNEEKLADARQLEKQPKLETDGVDGPDSPSGPANGQAKAEPNGRRHSSEND